MYFSIFFVCCSQMPATETVIIQTEQKNKAAMPLQGEDHFLVYYAFEELEGPLKDAMITYFKQIGIVYSDDVSKLSEKEKEYLATFQYKHAPYEQFYVTDPKQRHISKATVKDRLVHQIVYDTLSAVLNKKFIFHSLSSRLGKGTHAGVSLLQKMIRKVSANGSKPLKNF